MSYQNTTCCKANNNTANNYHWLSSFCKNCSEAKFTVFKSILAAAILV